MTNSFASMPPSAAVTVRAPAKVNLILRVLDRRPDGFHNLWSFMQTVGLHDEVRIGVNPDHNEIRLQCDAHSLSSDRTNLVYRAAEAVLHAVERSIGLDIVLEKRIPMGAGLGGGSSDAAATIVGLNRLLNRRWTAEEMGTIGQALGSDVPFFFFAPSAVVSGRGEIVQPVSLSGNRWIVLVNPGFPVETKWAYQELSHTRTAVHPVSDSLIGIQRESRLSWEDLVRHAQNDFETPVYRTHPILMDVKNQLMQEGAETALLSGSGATVFGVFREERQAKRAMTSFQVQSAFKVYAVPAESGPLTIRP